MRATESARSENARNLSRFFNESEYTFKNQCIAVAMDPADGTPGVGWAVAADLRTTEAEALAKCEATAGPGRRAACKVDSSGCDGTAK